MTARYTPLTQQEIKQLTQAELIQIIECHKDSIIIFAGTEPRPDRRKVCITPEISWVSENGLAVQINLDFGSQWSHLINCDHLE